MRAAVPWTNGDRRGHEQQTHNAYAARSDSAAPGRTLVIISLFIRGAEAWGRNHSLRKRLLFRKMQRGREALMYPDDMDVRRTETPPGKPAKV